MDYNLISVHALEFQKAFRGLINCNKFVNIWTATEPIHNPIHGVSKLRVFALISSESEHWLVNEVNFNFPHQTSDYHNTEFLKFLRFFFFNSVTKCTNRAYVQRMYEHHEEQQHQQQQQQNCLKKNLSLQSSAVIMLMLPVATHLKQTLPGIRRKRNERMIMKMIMAVDGGWLIMIEAWINIPRDEKKIFIKLSLEGFKCTLISHVKCLSWHYFICIWKARKWFIKSVHIFSV